MFSTIDLPFPIFMKFLAIISSMQNQTHIIILNQKTNTNAKLPVTNSASIVIPNQH